MGESLGMFEKSVNRWVSVGDIVIQRLTSHGREGDGPWTGIVYKIADPRGSCGSVHLHWTPCDPPDYREAFGLSRVNIHNMNSTYEVVNK